MKSLLLLLALAQEPIFKPTAPAKESGTYLVVFSASWCGPCQRWKANEKPKLKGVFVTSVDIDEQRQWGVASVPEFWIVDRATRNPIKKFSGYTSAETLMKALSPPVAEPQIVSASFGHRGTSHESRQTLIDHLMTDGIHKGRHTLTTLQAMTDQQLSDVHDADHNQSAGTPAATQWTVRPQVRRRRLFRW
jgi:hypothetical protein